MALRERGCNYLNEEKKEGIDGKKKRTMKRMNFYQEDET
jgi:hypothetical protein